MSSKNDITGDPIQTRGATKAYSDGWDAIFGNKKKIDITEVDDNKNDDKSEESKHDDN